jgi:hypothetical protein
MNAPALRDAPDWVSASEILIEGCVALPTEDARVRWIEQLCLTLGDALYPAFLRVLCLVGERGEAIAQRSVAATLMQALVSGRLPAGRRAAWGAVGLGATRSHGPLEYLCAWYLHPPSADTLSASGFDRAARALVGLISHDSRAQQLYSARLLATADDQLEGAWSRSDRAALRALAQAWKVGVGADVPVSAFLRAANAPPGPASGFATFGGAPLPATPWDAPAAPPKPVR